MVAKKDIAKFFSDFWKIDLSKISDDLVLDDNTLNDFTSIHFYQFLADFEEKFDISFDDISEIKTFRDLIKDCN